MQKIDFLVAGTQKGGTTALFHYLSKHAEIGIGERKEIHFFDRDAYADEANPKNIARAYHNHFTDDALSKTTGDFTPIYMYWKPCPTRIHRYNPNIKLILSLRNPIERAFSHWNMERSRGAESLPFDDAIRTEAHRLRDCPNQQHRVYSYIDRGRYHEQIKRLLRLFPESNILLYRSEELITAPRETLEKICTFLGVSRPTFTEPARIHHTPYKSTLAPEDRKYLIDALAPSIEALENLTGWSLSDWTHMP